MAQNSPVLRTEIPFTQSRLGSLIKVSCSYGGYIPDPNTQNGVPTQMPPWTLVGGLTKVDVEAKRGATERRELNYDTMAKILEMIPGLVDFSVKFSYVYLYRASLMEACGFDGFTLEYQTRPLLFSLQLPSPTPSSIPPQTLVLTDCWLGSNPIAFNVEQKTDLRIIQEVEIHCGGIFKV